MKKPTVRSGARVQNLQGYNAILSDMVALLEEARRASARTVNAIMTATYWEIGRRIVEFEQQGRQRALYGKEVLLRLSTDLTARFGRGFSVDNLERFRAFHLNCPIPEISATASRKSGVEKSATVSRISGDAPAGSAADTRMAQRPLRAVAARFPLSWSHYVRLLSVKNPVARRFYETETLRGGWSIRQLNRQINSQFYERTALSRNKVKMLTTGTRLRQEDAVTAEEEIRDPWILEFLDLKDEYSEHDLEEALTRHIESFLLELGGEFTFVGRQRRLRIDDAWYRIDLLFFHRTLHALVILDLKLGPLVPADVGQMHLYCNYARAHWTLPGENPPVGVILCSNRGDTLARYALEGLPNKMLVREYRTALPAEELLADEIARTRRILEGQR